jgi:glycosyl transferase family 25
MQEIEFSIISLRSQEARRRHMVAQMEAFRLPWSLFDARTSENPPIPYSEAEAAIDWRGPLTPGEIGCFASHYACLAEFVAQQTARYRIVVEDDVQLDPGFWYERLPSLMDACKLDYLRLYAKFPFKHRLVAIFGQHYIIRYRSGPLGTQGYVISQEGARRFLESIDRISRPVDWEIDRYWNHGLPPYTLGPHPLFEKVQTSTIKKIKPKEYPATPMQRIQRRIRLDLGRTRRQIEHFRLFGRDRQMRRDLLAWWEQAALEN